MPILSPHRVSMHGKVVNLKFVSILGRNVVRLILFKKKLYPFLSTLQRDHDALGFMVFGGVLREQLCRQFRGGSDVGKLRPEL